MVNRERAALTKILRIAESARGPAWQAIADIARKGLIASGRRIEFAVALPPRELCGNGRAGKFERTELVAMVREATALIAAQAHRAALGVTSDAEIKAPYFPSGRVAVRVRVRRDPLWSRTKLDDDNVQRGLKPVLDALQDARIVANDRQCFYDGKIAWDVASPLRGEVVLTLIADTEDE